MNSAPAAIFFNGPAREPPSVGNMMTFFSSQLLTRALAPIVLFTLGGCSGQVLDGGSTNPKGQGLAGDDPAEVGDPIPETPLAGTVAGQDFVPKSIEIQYDSAASQWFLSLRNYEVSCGRFGKGETPPSSEALVVTIGGVEPEAGARPITYGDGHGATFQAGVYEKGGPEPVIHSGTDGTLRLDTWTEVAGETIEGALRLQGEDGSEVAGTFAATVCPAR
jgi:hypothetical protein